MRKSASGFATLTIILFAVIVTVVISFIFYSFPEDGVKIESSEETEPSNVEDNPTGIVPFSYSQEDIVEKEALISSHNVDDVMTAIKLGHVPVSVAVDENSYLSIHLTAFRINLDSNNRYQKLNEYLNIAQFPSSAYPTLNNTAWRGFSYTEASDMYTKDGYACILLRPNRFQVTPSMSCSNALVLAENTFADVSSFMKKTLMESGVDCTVENCEITETEEAFPLHEYGRYLIYFDKSISRSNDGQLIDYINTEMEAASKFLESSGWEVSLEQYTEMERTWNEEVLVSVMVRAKNDLFSCVHHTTVMNLGKRSIIECSYNNDMLIEVQKFYNPYE